MNNNSFRIKSLIGEEATCWLISPYRLSVFWESGVHEFWSPKDMEEMIAHYGWEKLPSEEELPRTFKFQVSPEISEYGPDITYTYKETKGGNNVFWGDSNEESIQYSVNSIRKLIAAGDWIVLPSEPEKKPDEDFTRQCIDKLNTYTSCMSYNDSYFGEPEGELKRVIRELDKTYNKSKEKIVDTLQLKIEIDGIKEAQEVLDKMVEQSNTTLEAIKSFTTGTGHDVWIAEGTYKVYRKSEDMPYICHTDTILIEVMKALVTLDEVGKEGGI